MKRSRTAHSERLAASRGRQAKIGKKILPTFVRSLDRLETGDRTTVISRIVGLLLQKKIT